MIQVLASVSIPVEQLIEIEKTFYGDLHSFWYDYNFLTIRWWFIVFLTIIPPIIWWIFVDKKRLIEITAYGLFFGVIAIVLDSIGSYLLLWVYPIRLSPLLFPQLYPYDIGVIIIPFMLVYQRWGGSFKSFFISAGALSAIIAFICEAGMQWLGYYTVLTWKNAYSFPIYWFLGIFCWTIITYFKKLEQKR